MNNPNSKTNKVKMKSIRIKAEGQETSVTFYEWDTANKMLEFILESDSFDIGYNKTDFSIVWEDGYRWDGRIDVCQDETNLGKRILREAHYSTGLHCPELYISKYGKVKAWKTYSKIIKNRNIPTAKYVSFLETYEVLK